MRHHRDLSRGHRRRRRGVGLVELLIALAISAALLTATAVAIDASFRGFQANTERSDLTQRARLSLYRMTAAIRQAAAQYPADPQLASKYAGGATVTDTGITLIDAANVTTTFIYDPAKQEVTAIVNGNAHTMVSGVVDFRVRMEPARSPTAIRTGGGWDVLNRATVTLTVKGRASTPDLGPAKGHEVLTLSGSVMPRRNTL
jgi:prepilin-type N-terminal cleavage/methylation domain-containing protein